MEAWIGAIVTSDDLSETTLRRCSLAALLLATLPDPMRPLAKHLRFVEELRRCPYMSRKCSIKLAHIVSGIAAAKTIDPDSNGRIDDNTLTARQFCTRHADAIIDLIGARLDAASVDAAADLGGDVDDGCSGALDQPVQQALVDTMRFVCSLVQPLKPSGSSRQSLPLSSADFTKPSLRNCILWQFSAQLNFSTDWQFLLSLLPSNKARRGGSGSIESECVERLRLLHTCLCRSESSANGLLNAPSILESVPAITESLHLVSRPESLKLLFEIAVGIFSSGTKNRDSNQSVDELIECTGDLLRQGWRVLESEYLAVQHCWPPVAAYLRLLATEPICLGLPAAAPAAGRQILLEAIDSVLASSENRVGLAEALTRELLTTASVAVADCRGSWDEEVLLRLLLAGLIFGPVHRRFQRYAGRVHVYLETAYDKGWPFNMEAATRESSDRVPSLEFLCRLPQCACERHSGFVRSLLLRLRQHYDGLCQAKVYKNFTNSAAHRQKHRIFCALLCLAPHLPLHTDLVLDWMVHCLRTELIASVRSQTEWIISLLCLDSTTRAINMLYDLLESSKFSTDSRPAFVTCLLSVSILVANQLLADSDSRLSDHVTRVLTLAADWCLAQQLQIRLHAQIAELRLSSMAASAARLKDAAVESRLAQRSDFLRRSRHAFRKLGLLERHWWLSDFLPRGHLSLDSVCRLAPALWGLQAEELILPDQWSIASTPTGCSAQQPVVTVNSAASIEPLERQLLLPNRWQAAEALESAVLNAASSVVEQQQESAVNEPTLSSLQRKPQSAQQCSQPATAVGAASAAGGLIIVASLIDKANNLGGLCRSAESFGISDVCLPSLRLLADPEFDQLSLGAHRWLRLAEVPPGQPLLDFLRRQRAEGVALIGLEQTERSRPMHRFQFPATRRCLLLLGHEKRGIPPDLIGELDACLEIPMSGVVRSLNVHVSAALALWEYRRQRLLLEDCTAAASPDL
ncbi:hypothetical protein BOX15_Mlig032297g4 [Macrostomum lignano]|uniref:tRNA/rRNA methyltransferase SpoU type domain-containing protein n=1 Tax=Macrostomum lignano TaxID=282301 RepID=A0A267FQB1_9PLAT|nr:hypothetical protein BOX15_Mlig032297g4 [Macrostomum lignano]